MITKLTTLFSTFLVSASLFAGQFLNAAPPTPPPPTPGSSPAQVLKDKMLGRLWIFAGDRLVRAGLLRTTSQVTGLRRVEALCNAIIGVKVYRLL